MNLEPSNGSGKKPQGRYIFVRHQSKRERIRRLRQAFRGQLAPEQFYDYSEYQEAVGLYLALVSKSVA